jgi:hypothetical protein
MGDYFDMIESEGLKTNTEVKSPALKDLLSCPFCDAVMTIESNRDWHRLKGNHDADCVFETEEEAMMVPATDENLAWMVAAWNRRAAR